MSIQKLEYLQSKAWLVLREQGILNDRGNTTVPLGFLDTANDGQMGILAPVCLEWMLLDCDFDYTGS